MKDRPKVSSPNQNDDHARSELAIVIAKKIESHLKKCHDAKGSNIRHVVTYGVRLDPGPEMPYGEPEAPGTYRQVSCVVTTARIELVD